MDLYRTVILITILEAQCALKNMQFKEMLFLTCLNHIITHLKVLRPEKIKSLSSYFSYYLLNLSFNMLNIPSFFPQRLWGAYKDTHQYQFKLWKNFAIFHII